MSDTIKSGTEVLKVANEMRLVILLALSLIIMVGWQEWRDYRRETGMENEYTKIRELMTDFAEQHVLLETEITVGRQERMEAMDELTREIARQGSEIESAIRELSNRGDIRAVIPDNGV